MIALIAEVCCGRANAALHTRSAKSENKGLRLDYFLASRALADPAQPLQCGAVAVFVPSCGVLTPAASVVAVEHLADAAGRASDHCPIALTMTVA